MFLSQHGGYSNGSTDCESTNYIFEVGPEHLREALDRFAQFFISPLFRQEAMDRELCAIESEFNQAKQSDSVRLEKIMCNTSRENHPFRRFGWGNTKSLRDLPSQSEIDVRQEIIDFYHQYYSANMMKLVVQGHDSLDQMEGWVRESFGPIPNRNVQPPVFSEMPWDFDAQAVQVFRMSPVRETNQLYITWALDPLMGKYKHQPDEYLAHLLGHESEGSILSLLKSKGWAVSVQAGINTDDGYEFSTCASLFTVSFKLTDPGLEHWAEIVTFVYQYIELIRQNEYPEWVFAELKAISEMGFRFIEEENPICYVEELASVMQDRFQIERKNILRHGVISGDFSVKQVSDLCDQLVPERMRIHLLSQSFDTTDWMVEHWFETPYSVDTTPAMQWNNVKLHPMLRIPDRNPFVPTDFTLCTTHKHHHPELLQETPYTKLWFKSDGVFKIPKANFNVLVVTPGGKTAQESALESLFVRLVKDALNEFTYQASVAELEYSFRLHDVGFQLQFSGFNHKLSVLVERVMACIAKATFEPERFEYVKEELLREYHNMHIKSSKKADYERLLLLRQKIFPNGKIAQALQQIEFSQLNESLRQIVFPSIQVSALLHGNATKEKAIELMQMIEQHLLSQVSPGEYRPVRVLKLPQSKSLLVSRPSNHPEEVNAVIQMYFQIGEWNLNDYTLVEVIQQIMEEPLFDTLRTKEQLGYRVSCSTRLTHGVIGFAITIQSAAYPVEYLEQRVRLFLDSFRQDLINLSPQVFANHIDALIQRNLEPDTSLWEETSRHWAEIETRRYSFDFHEKSAALLRTIHLSDVIAQYHKWMGETSRKLCVHIHASKGEAATTQDSPQMYDQVVSDTLKYKSELDSFPNLI